jgi:hypothetical protein
MPCGLDTATGSAGRQVTGIALVRPVSAKAWDLRAAWGAGWRVSVLTDIPGCGRLEGIVTRVAATDAYAQIAGRLVPLDRVLSVHSPSRLGDSTAGARWSGPPLQHVPQLEQLFDV